jgi:DNA-binding NtrC family response regulator
VPFCFVERRQNGFHIINSMVRAPKPTPSLFLRQPHFWHRFCLLTLATMKLLCNKSVLLIDDDAAMLRALEKVLTGEGCEVICTTLAREAMEILAKRKTQIDLVVTDLWMPFVTGLTSLYGIHHLFPDLPIIVLTGYCSPDVEAACFRQGAAAVLEKPLDTSQLLNALEGVFASQKTSA